MSPEQFQQHMTRLAATFRNTYSDERVRLIRRQVEREDAGWWERTVDYLIGNCRQAPLAGDINDLLLIERERQHRIRKHQPLPPVSSPSGSCHECKGLGIVICASRENVAAMKADTEGRAAFAPYAFRCECDIGRSDPRAFPFFNAAAVSNGFYRIEIRA